MSDSIPRIMIYVYTKIIWLSMGLLKQEEAFHKLVRLSSINADTAQMEKMSTLMSPFLYLF